MNLSTSHTARIARMKTLREMVVALKADGWKLKEIGSECRGPGVTDSAAAATVSRIYRATVATPDWQFRDALAKLYAQEMSSESTRFIRRIKSLHKKSWTNFSIAKKFEVTEKTIFNLARGIIKNPKYFLGANVIAVDEDKYPAELPDNVEDFQHLLDQLMGVGMSHQNIADALPFDCARTVITGLSSTPGRVPNYWLGYCLIRLWSTKCESVWA